MSSSSSHRGDRRYLEPARRPTNSRATSTSVRRLGESDGESREGPAERAPEFGALETDIVRNRRDPSRIMAARTSSPPSSRHARSWGAGAGFRWGAPATTGGSGLRRLELLIRPRGTCYSSSGQRTSSHEDL